jgi:hypothetical protein
LKVRVMNKSKITPHALEALIVSRLRDLPGTDMINGVAITRPESSASHHPNWGAGFTATGAGTAPGVAFELVGKLQGEYEVVWG